MKAQEASHYKKFISRAYLLQLADGSFSGPVLARETGKTYGYTSNMIKAMLSRGLISRVSEKIMLGSGGKSCLRGFSPSQYKLTKKGRSLIRVVLSGGVFDILHPGHVHFLTQARVQGDILVVVLARDSLVKRNKGRAPVNRENDRLLMISSLRHVDAALLGSETSYSGTLDRVSPDVVCLGHDQKADLRKVKRYVRETGRRVEISVAKKLEGYSTSSILSRSQGRAK